MKCPSIAPARWPAGGGSHLVDCDDLHPPASTSRIEADERGRPDAHRRSATLRARRRSRVSSGVPGAGSVVERLVRAGLSDHRGLDRGLHRLRLAAALRVADESGDLCVRESGGGGCLGIFLGGEAVGPAHAAGDTAGAGERGRDHDHEEEQGPAPVLAPAATSWKVRVGRTLLSDAFDLDLDPSAAL